MDTQSVVQGIWGAALANDRKCIRQRIDMFRDKWADMVKDEIKTQFSPAARERLLPLVTTEVNVLKKSVEETSQVYQKAPRRTVKDLAGNAIERWAEIEKECRANIFWKEDNKYTRLCNHTLVKVVSREGKIELDLFTPDSFLIFTDPNDWKKINAIAIEIGERTPPPGGNAIARPYERMRTQIWAKEDTDTPWGMVKAGTIATTKEGKIISTEPNPYIEPADQDSGEPAEICLPFFLTFKNFPIDALLDLQDGDSLFHANIEIGVLLILLNEIIKFQSFNQPYLLAPVGTKVPESQQMGAWSFMSVQTTEAKGQIGTLQLETDAGKLWAVIQERISYILAQQGIPPSAYQIQKSPQSGYSMRIERKALEEIRKNDVEFYREFEGEAFEKIRIVNNYHQRNPKKQIPWNAIFSIDFSEPDTVYTMDEVIKQETHELTNNLTTEAKLLMKRNPDLTEEAANKEILENRRANINIAPLPEFGAPSPGSPAIEAPGQAAAPGEAPGQAGLQAAQAAGF